MSPKVVEKEKQRPRETPIPEVSKTMNSKPTPPSQSLLGAADLPA